MCCRNEEHGVLAALLQASASSLMSSWLSLMSIAHRSLLHFGIWCKPPRLWFGSARFLFRGFSCGLFHSQLRGGVYKAPPPFCLSPSLVSIFSRPQDPSSPSPRALFVITPSSPSSSSSSSAEFPLLIIINSGLKSPFRPPHPPQVKAGGDGNFKRSRQATSDLSGPGFTPPV